MKHNHRITFVAFVLLFSYLLAACGQALPAASAQGGSDSQAVEFAGKVEAIKDNQWTISGEAVEVSAELAKEAKFQVGDEVKVSAVVNADGSVQAENIVALSVASASETPEPTATLEPTATIDPTVEPTATLDPTATIEPTPTGDNSNDNNNNDNSNDDNSNDDNSNDDNGNDDNGYGLSFFIMA